MYELAIDLSGNVPDEHLLEIPDRPAASVLLSLSSDNNSFLFLGIYSLKCILFFTAYLHSSAL